MTAGGARLTRGTGLRESDRHCGPNLVMPVRHIPVVRDIAGLRLRAPLPQASADDGAYRDLVSGHRATAEPLGYEGHIGWTAKMRPV